MRFAASQEIIFLAECRKNKGFNANLAENGNENNYHLGCVSNAAISHLFRILTLVIDRLRTLVEANVFTFGINNASYLYMQVKRL
ncbi:hypothetical protein ACJJIW_00300 [Microbulbifer sp. JMSA004]|uniref:hypothetical protein n=1 Tax=unclassified Microbulbifer TaxID=2619833 RepID=UPI0024AE4AAA|nr:hypothetical protein [Microbulbifer sp. VAAF005]WHI48177.1 hypothetical protein P0078_07340 [Microbulbifer sp. VAAF005]